MRKTILLTLLLLTCSGVGAQRPDKRQEALRQRGLGTITAEAARAHVYFLASDLLKGRKAGEEGSRLAAEYIISRLREQGVRPLLRDYGQPFEAVSRATLGRARWFVEPDSVARVKAGRHQSLRLRNILGVIPGQRDDEYVVIGAHLDHEGMNPLLEGDQIYNGADDNASGVSAVLQIMKAFAESGAKPVRTLVFAFWDGEEEGLLGSRYFTETCPYINKVRGYINFDMIGRDPKPGNPSYMVYFYTAAHPEFGDWLRADIRRYGLRLDPNYRPWDYPVGGSDNGSFAKKGVPVVWYHTDGHPDYNQPTDEPQLINYEKTAEITRAAYLCAWRMANP
ncbi:aminopeptidase [Prevotella sp. oral taxon 376]|uniref:M20/M25/M40 family metallo-hydrolase n=1 Tax=Prevotella sp. oral taxon 376 TaxID=712466 RepID=UPI000D1E0A07|nr:M20/M25/M40 family metallo-hydrolase [Prevotella sp. oral taxon 376]PTL34822.1 aminopeptidase [Prevotella sp. oral taxon 376]